MHLNVSALSDPNSLCISLVSLLVCAPDYLQPISIQTLVDSGSTRCFLDSAFARGHSLPTTPTPPVELHLFDGTLMSQTSFSHISTNSSTISTVLKPA